jgi:biopolymer transport protein ExbD
MKLKTANKVKVEAGMASMTDLVFLLLLFFIIMSTLSEPQTPLDLPEANPGTPTSQQTRPEISVGVNPDNTYFVNSGNSAFENMSYEEARDVLLAEMANSEDKKLKIAGDKEASYEAVFKLISLCQAENWSPLLAYDKNSKR